MQGSRNPGLVSPPPRTSLQGTKQFLSASYHLWQKIAYASSGSSGEFRQVPRYVVPGRGHTMGSGDQPSRRLERRWAPRYLFRADLEIEWGSAVLRGSTRDVSASGMFIEAPDTLWVGAGFSARLNLSNTVRLDCSVRRVEPGHGMGVSVAHTEEESERLYRELLAALSRTAN